MSHCYTEAKQQFANHTLPIYAYLHADGHAHYAILDNFFQSAFGGSFLNHQWLIAGATPTWPGAPAANHSIVDTNGMPNNYALYHATTAVRDAQLTVASPGHTVEELRELIAIPPRIDCVLRAFARAHPGDS